MATFGLITEGVTDQAVIENILAGYFKNLDIDTNSLLPIRDETDKYREENYSNWLKVFEYCASSKFRESFQFNDYIIIQIDTYVSDESGFNIPKYQDSKELTPEELITKVLDKFQKLIGQDFYQKYQARIIFAIAVHSIECWLLPLYFQENHKASAIKGCLEKLKSQLKKTKNSVINKKYRDYYQYSLQYCKHKTLMNCYHKNPSLKIFIEEINSRKISILEEND